MPNTSEQAKWLAASPTLVVAIFVAGLFAGYVLLVRNAGGAPHGESGFEERAQAAGITFRMNFLTKEQGERFRINLYDHEIREPVQ